MMETIVARRDVAAARADARSAGACFERKRRELSLLNNCLSTPLSSLRPQSWAAAAELKFRLAALLKADQLLGRWSVTETARPPGQWKRAGPFAFSFGYQRADLEVYGPPIYPSVQRTFPGCDQSTVYTGSGMAAIAALLTALLQCNESIDVAAQPDSYGETRDLMRSLGPRVRMVPATSVRAATVDGSAAHILWLDSSTHSSYGGLLDATECIANLVVLDTTCFWRDSGKIGHAIRYALRAGIPIVLVRSHAKLDNLGIEYGRLGSLVIVAPASGAARRSHWTTALLPRMRDAVRLLGAAPTLAHFPPFEQSSDYLVCTALRTASIIRSTRRIARGLASRWPAAKPRTFQHGLYFTVSIGDDATMDEMRAAADEMAMDLTAQGFPVRHAGSFGFDFIAVEAYSDPVDARCVLRICGGDIPVDMSEEIGYRMAGLGHGSRC